MLIYSNREKFSKNGNMKKIVLYASFGGMLEFYDFVTYVLLAEFLSAHFFAMADKTMGLIATFSTFAIGYLIRPIGGIIFGHFGDKYGRKKPFILTVLMMGVSTFLMGCIPSYQSIGILAPICLLILRICQGFSIGGEIPGEITYISEITEKKKGRYTGYLFAGLIAGIVLGSIMIKLLYMFLNHAQIQLWGWRIPFLLGGLFGFASYYARKQFYESPAFAKITNHLHRIPSLVMFKSNFRNLFSAICFVANGAVITVLLFLFIPTFLTKTLFYPPTLVASYVAIFLSISAVIVIFSGCLADYLNKINLLRLVSLLSLIAAIPIFYFYHQHLLFIPFAISALLEGMAWGVTLILLAELFPTAIRYSGIGLAYSLGFAIFGGLTPVTALLLIDYTKSAISPAFLLIFTSILALIGSGTAAVNFKKAA